MSWQHLKTIVWLRWRISLNQAKRSGTTSVIVTIVLLVAGAALSVCMFLGALIGGVHLLPEASADHVLYAWDAIIVVFLFFWFLGLFSDLQRSEMISLDNLLHLPISLKGTFLLNYLSSLLAVSTIMFIPTMVGFSIALIAVKGSRLMVVVPLLIGLIFMVSAVTYQFRGWLATLMANKRKRRTIIVILTTGFILLSQIPNLLNFTFFRTYTHPTTTADEEFNRDTLILGEALTNGEINDDEYQQRYAAALEDYQAKKERADSRTQARIDRISNWSNLMFPPGWLAYGTRAAILNNPWPGLLGVVLMWLIGSASLARSYKTTLRIYRDGLQRKRPRTHRSPTTTKRTTTNLIEKTVPWISEQASTIAMANFRGLLRAPEAKMALLSPIIIGGVFLSAIVGGRGGEMSIHLRPLAALGIIGAAMFSITQLLMNQFGYDRDGFRTLVLIPADRRDILLGKNLSMAPIAMAFGLIGLIVLQFISPLRTSHFLASMFQLVSVFIIFCLVGNLISILVPLRVASGALRPAKPKLTTVFIHFLLTLLFPVALIPSAIPFGLEWLSHQLGWAVNIPIYLALSVISFGIVLLLYKIVLNAQGEMLRRREKRMLEIVTSKLE